MLTFDMYVGVLFDQCQQCMNSVGRQQTMLIDLLALPTMVVVSGSYAYGLGSCSVQGLDCHVVACAIQWCFMPANVCQCCSQRVWVGLVYALLSRGSCEGGGHASGNEGQDAGMRANEIAATWVDVLRRVLQAGVPCVWLCRPCCAAYVFVLGCCHTMLVGLLEEGVAAAVCMIECRVRKLTMF